MSLHDYIHNYITWFCCVIREGKGTHRSLHDTCLLSSSVLCRSHRSCYFSHMDSISVNYGHSALPVQDLRTAVLLPITLNVYRVLTHDQIIAPLHERHRLCSGHWPRWQSCDPRSADMMGWKGLHLQRKATYSGLQVWLIRCTVPSTRVESYTFYLFMPLCMSPLAGNFLICYIYIYTIYLYRFHSWDTAGHRQDLLALTSSLLATYFFPLEKRWWPHSLQTGLDMHVAKKSLAAKKPFHFNQCFQSAHSQDLEKAVDDNGVIKQYSVYHWIPM